ncbi:3-ketoacyl-CoA thiolase [Caballeronia sordidicola]|uniref:3-ketoacyl-CoA thiolase n=1 Tax=Caballeronia sordidicola TaxID=196367 RepID=A0A242MKA4_CABSO|nr:3-ketoacyl-CoA thiolase [Caballeronia sordidicola]
MVRARCTQRRLRSGRHRRCLPRDQSERIAATRLGADDGGRRGADRLGGSAAPVATPVVININIIRIRSGDRND